MAAEFSLENMGSLAWALGLMPLPSVESSQIRADISRSMIDHFLPGLGQTIADRICKSTPGTDEEAIAREYRFCCAQCPARRRHGAAGLPPDPSQRRHPRAATQLHLRPQPVRRLGKHGLVHLKSSRLGGNSMGESCHVYCRSGTIDLEDAARLLAECGQTVARRDDHLTTGWPGGPQFRVWCETGEHVRSEAAAIGEGTQYEAAMRDCDARFVIGIDDLDDALDEINTLIEMQCTLQEASGGFLHLSWNNNLSGP